MAKLYLLGGERVVRRDAWEINAAAFGDAGSAPRVLVFSWAKASFDRAFRRKQLLFRYLQSLGAREVGFAEFSEPLEDLAGKVAGADLVYLAGGQLSILFSRLQQTGVDELLRGYGGVIVGRSAGALVLGRYGVVTTRYSGAAKIVPGLGLADFTVKVHYKPFKDEILKRFSMQERIYAIPEKAALVCENGALSVLGKVVLFENGEKQVLCSSGEKEKG
ncbi:MAG: Type 1 glutamine amidotransferase-like domain-containing protein [Candidatus Bathyarchaeota archaeon]|nr:Type 1 glutamine amidotransferase-like domain-containing protein [Candidatus Bathyarchaeota archaeon]